MKRDIKPRPAIALRPAYVSDETCFAVLGLTPRKFRDLLVPRCAGVVRFGHTALVPLEAAEGALHAMAASDGPAELETPDAPPQPTTADGVLALLGRRRAS